MGDVELTSKALVKAMEGRPVARPEKLSPFIVGERGTPNQRYMAAGASLFIPALQEAGVAAASRMLEREIQEGPRTWEVLCPDPHEGMYLLARVGIVAAGYNAPSDSRLRELGRRAALILGQELRLADLVATPDGDCRGLPGMRAPNGKGLSRRALSTLWIEVRRRQGVPVLHRGTGGRPKPLKWDRDGDALVEAPAFWMGRILDGEHGQELLDGPLSRDLPLPKCLRLGLTVHRWDGGTLALLDDPGLAERRQFVITGSAAAKRDADRDEDPTTWIKVDWAAPAKHGVAAGECWETSPPQPPDNMQSARIPGV